MALRDEITARREEILRIAERHGARNVRLFGSVLRGEERSDSDVDFLVEMSPNRTAFDRLEIKFELEDMLGRKVDVLSDRSIYHLLRKKILSEAQAI